MSSSVQDLSAHVLEEAVRLVTADPTSAPREGQGALSAAIARAMSGTAPEPGVLRRGRHIAQAPTGSGKSLSHLAPAMTRAARCGERTVISTDSKSLQTQIVDKDAPLVAQATEKVTGVAPTVAVVKGWSNYACVAQAVATAREILGDTEEVIPRDQLAAKVRAKRRGSVTIGDRKLGLAELSGLVHWALTDDGAGDRDSCPDPVSDEAWRTVSVSKSECHGADCPFFAECKPQASRTTAADADVIVTNHSMIAIQAALGVPVILGNKSLGAFHHLVIDEAHTLPAKVRDHGARSVSRSRIDSAVSALRRVLDEKSSPKLFSSAESLAADLDAELVHLASPGRGKEVALGKGDDPLERTGEALSEWIAQASAPLPKLCERDKPLVVRGKARRALARLQSLSADLTGVRKHSTLFARWVSTVDKPKSKARAEVCVSPVDVAAPLRANLWTVMDLPAEGDPADDACVWQIGEDEWTEPPSEDGKELPRYQPSVTCLSGTLGPGFAVEIGMGKIRPVDYPSPFDKAYAASLLYIPSTTPRDVSALRNRRNSGSKPQLDTGRHADWAASQIERLVKANGGSALILSATSRAGRQYAEHLRTALRGTGIRVLSQWDGQTAGAVTAAWREDEKSVLVGTKSLMTGTDAKGETASLVVLDRVPRAAFNPVDDARVAAKQEALQISKWDADRQVYAADAALLLEQAAGRLIRSVDDSGAVAVLDPRLVKGGTFTYHPSTRTTYRKALRRFERETSELAEVERFLRTRRRR